MTGLPSHVEAQEGLDVFHIRLRIACSWVRQVVNLKIKHPVRLRTTPSAAFTKILRCALALVVSEVDFFRELHLSACEGTALHHSRSANRASAARATGWVTTLVINIHFVCSINSKKNFTVQIHVDALSRMRKSFSPRSRILSIFAV